MGFAILIIWFVMYLIGHDWAYKFHKSLWSGLTRHDFSMLNLYGMTFFKLFIFGVFLLPYFAIRLVLCAQREGLADAETGASPSP